MRGREPAACATLVLRGREEQEKKEIHQGGERGGNGGEEWELEINAKLGGSLSRQIRKICIFSTTACNCCSHRLPETSALKSKA